LNHLLATDRIWMQRFTGVGDDAILFETFDELRTARELEDRRIVDFVDGLDDARIAGKINYRRVSSPEQFEQQLAPALADWFNHQTRHRGQVHAVLPGWSVRRRNSIFCFFSGCRQNRPPESGKPRSPGAGLRVGGVAVAGGECSKTTDSAATDPLIY
jgi:hypothetical protein